jgi:hypothetical protein
MPCTICQHPQRRDIDQALIAGSATLAALSQEYGLSTSALHRHKEHLQAKVSQAKDQLQDNLRQGCLFWLSRMLEMVMHAAETAQVEGNSKVVLQAITQGTRIIAIMLKQDFQLDPAVVFEVLASPQWNAQASVLPDATQILAVSRQALTGSLLSRCPDTADAPASPASLEDLELFQDLLSQAHLTAQPSTENPKLETENRLPQPREKSGKLPGKTSPSKDNNKESQEDKLYEKIAETLNLLQPSRFANLGTRDSKLETLFSGTIPTDIPLSEYIYEQNLKRRQDEKKGGKSALV